MYKINLYLMSLTIKYILINLVLISLIILFINLIEISRIVDESNNNLTNYLLLSILKYPTILNEIIPFVTIIGIAFLFRNLINNNELISMRNTGYSIFDIFLPIGISVFLLGLFFLFLVNPLSVYCENRFQNFIDKNEQNLYSIKILNNEMWIKNKVDKDFSSFINIKNINFKNMIAKDIKILLINGNENNFIYAKSGVFEKNVFLLNDIKFYNIDNDNYIGKKKYELQINFTKDNLINSIHNYKLIPFYKYYSHANTLKKFNLYSPEIGLFYLSEILKPLFIVMLSFIVIGFSGKFKRNENFFKILFMSILIGFFIFLLKEIINKVTISLSLNFIISYVMIFFIPFIIGLYQVIKIENDWY